MDFNDTAAKNIASALRQEASEFVESQRKINQIKEDIKAGVKSPSLPGVNNMLGNLNGEIQSIYQEIMDIASLTASEIKRQETEKKRQEEIQRKKEAELKAQQEREEQERLEQEARLKASQQEIQKKVSNKKSTKVNKKSKKSKRK